MSLAHDRKQLRSHRVGYDYRLARVSLIYNHCVQKCISS